MSCMHKPYAREMFQKKMYCKKCGLEIEPVRDYKYYLVLCIQLGGFIMLPFFRDDIDNVLTMLDYVVIGKRCFASRIGFGLLFSAVLSGVEALYKLKFAKYRTSETLENRD